MKRLMQMLAMAFALGAAMANAQDFPRQPIRIIVPFAAGTTTDILARVVSEELKASLGQPVHVENRSGATGLVGAGMLARAPADGYTIGIGNEATHVTLPLLRKVAYDPLNDFTPLTMATRTTLAIAVNPSLLPVHDLPGLIAAAKTRADGVSFGARSEGSPPQLIGELLKQRTGGRFVHVPYEGSAPALEDLLAGRLAMVISTLPMLAPHQDRLRIIAVADEVRVPAFPGVQSIAETLPDVVVPGWSGFFAPAKLPPAIAAKLSSALAAALHKPAVAQALRKRAFEPVGGPPEELRELVSSGQQRWAPVLAKVPMPKLD